MTTLEYIELLLPNGLAYSNVEDSKKFNEVLALQADKVLNWIQYFQDQLWYINDEFDPETWETRYEINVPDFSSLEDRRKVVKSYMVWPQSDNRLSLDYLQLQLNNAGYTDVVISTNESGTVGRYMHANNTTLDEGYSIGSDTYNSITISGSIDVNLYDDMLLLVMSIKPLDTVVYDDVETYSAQALNDDYAIALNSTYTIALTTS